MVLPQLCDSYGRVIRYLRISLTEVCNYRCVYCTPEEGLQVTPNARYLVREEITRFVQIAGRLGIHRVRLTGGEPLLRKDLPEIIHSLKSIETVKDLSITTNASRLSEMLPALKRAGLDRINISLDSMEPERFMEITRVDDYRQVMKAIHEALDFGFPVKLNMVVLSGLTDLEIIDFVRLARDYPLEVRFLEFMPLCGSAWQKERVKPIDEVRRIVFQNFKLTQIPRGDEVAQSFRLEEGKGRVGFIASLTESFCDQCSRIRLSADGDIRPCLFSDARVSVKQLLRDKAPDEEIIEALREAARIKPAGNRFRDKPFLPDSGDDDLLPTLQAPWIRKIGG